MNTKLNDKAIQAEQNAALLGIESEDTQVKGKRTRSTRRASADKPQKAPRPATSTTIPVSDAEMSASERMAQASADESKNTGNKQAIGMNDSIPANDANEPEMETGKENIFPETEMNGASVGNDHQKAQIALIPKVAGKIRLCAIEKNEEFEEMTTTTITFAPSYLTEVRLPVKVQYRTHRVYANGETRISALHTATTKGIVDRSRYENEKTRSESIFCGDIIPQLIRFTYQSIVAGFLRLDNAIAHVTAQAMRGDKLVGHDETLRATTSKFLMRFARATVSAEKTPMSDAEFTAKAKAQYDMLLAALQNE